MPGPINVGDLVTLTAAFATVADGAPVNPSTVVVTVTDPAGNITTPAVSNPATGVFQVTVSITLWGEWQWKATGTGAAQTQGWATFAVPEPPF